MRVTEAAYFANTLEAYTLIPSTECMRNSHVAPDAKIVYSKLEHQHRACYSQGSNVTAENERHVLHVVQGLTGSVLAFEAGVVVACTSTATIDVDLLKNGVSILTAAIEIDNGDAAYAVVAGVISTAGIVDGDVLEVDIIPKGPDVNDFILEEHFVKDAGDTLPDAWGIDAETANSTEDYVTDQACGIYTLQHDATAEAQSMQLFATDNLWIDLFEKPIIEWRCRLDLTGTNALGSADQRVVVGVCSGHTNAEDALDATTVNAWFRMEGTSANILVETDDDSTNTDDQDSGVDLVDNTWTHFKIDFSNLADVKFHIDGVEQSGSAMVMSNISSSVLVQPIACIQRDGGAELEKVYVDVFKVTSGLSLGTLGKGVFASLTVKEDAA